MNTIITCEKDIIAAAKKLAAEKGFSNINIREVAKASGVSIGSIYNYFPGKSELIIAIIEDIWNSVLYENSYSYDSGNFGNTVKELFSTIYKGTGEYPNFLKMHALSFDISGKSHGRKAMEECFKSIKQKLLLALNRDKNVNFNVFNENFTVEDLVNFIFSNILFMLQNGEKSCDILIEAINRIIYSK